MPFIENQTRIYVSIVDGMFAVRSSESDTKAVKRELKTGHTIWERRYKSLEGRLKEISFKINDYMGKKWEDLNLLVFDGSDHYQISMPFPGKYSNSFLRVVKNIPLDSNIILNPWTKMVGDKTKAALFINIPGTKESVPWYYTKEDPKGMPELVQYTIPGSDEIKYSDVNRNNFLRHVINEEIAPRLREIWSSPIPPAATTNFTEAPVDLPDGPDDDLPF